MGDEARVKVRIGRKASEGKALLETKELLFRGEPALKIPFAQVTEVSAEDGVLRIIWTGGEARFELGDRAERWAKKIKSPKGRIDKLGVKAAQRVSVVGLADGAFLAELEARTKDVSRTARKDSDHLFFGAEARPALERLAALRAYLKPDGALWVVRPKGVKAITEGDVREAGKAAGLVDVKVVSFDETHTAEKFVIPVSQR